MMDKDTQPMAKAPSGDNGTSANGKPSVEGFGSVPANKTKECEPFRKGAPIEGFSGGYVNSKV